MLRKDWLSQLVAIGVFFRETRLKDSYLHKNDNDSN